MEEIIKTTQKVEDAIEEIKLLVLQSESLKTCGAPSHLDELILDKINNLNVEILNAEINGVDVGVAKGMFEVFIRELNLIKGIE